MRRQSDGRVALGHQIPDARVDLTFSDDTRAQHSGLDDRLSPYAFLEVRDHAPRHEIFQLTGDAGQGNDGASRVLHDEGRSGAHRVFDRDSPLGDVSLAAVVLRHRATKAGKARRYLIQQLLTKNERASCGVGYRFAGDVVHRGAQPARDKHDVGAIQGDVEHRRHALPVVADGALVMQVQPYIAQHAGHHCGVGVNDFAEQ